MTLSRHDRIFNQQLFFVCDAAEYLREVAIPDALDNNMTDEERDTLFALLDKAVQDLIAAAMTLQVAQRISTEVVR